MLLEINAEAFRHLFELGNLNDWRVHIHIAFELRTGWYDI
jgi:hypothetical protein